MDRSPVTAARPDIEQGRAAGPRTAEPGWTTAGIFPVAPGVHRIPLPLPNDALRAVNVYALEDGDGLVLVDSGWALAEARSRLEAALAELGHGLGDVCRFLITHVHRDHYTQAVALRREFGTRISLGIGERPSLELSADGHELKLAPQLRRLRTCGAAEIAGRLTAIMGTRAAEAAIWELPDEWLAGPAAIALRDRSLQPLPTPGHTRGHLCFLDAAAGLLFAGDHVLPHITPSIGFEPPWPPCRSVTTSSRCAWSGSVRTPCCYLLTGRSVTAPTPGLMRSCSITPPAWTRPNAPWPRAR